VTVEWLSWQRGRRKARSPVAGPCEAAHSHRMARAASYRSPFEESRGSRLGKRLVLAFILVQLPIGALSSYRAWVQIKELTLETEGPVLRAGTTVRSHLVSWARTESDARVELVQGDRVAMLGEVYVGRNHEPVFDPRPKRDSVVVTLSPATLEGFREGPATLRASAVGRPQWLRVPPPTVREQAVVIDRSP
jgi:hypothetical protein